jgi:hypothetical protein
MSKFWFFERKGRPTTGEKEICDRLTDLISDGQISENEIKEYIEAFNPLEKIAYEIAKSRLKTSFDIEKSIGFKN